MESWGLQDSLLVVEKEISNIIILIINFTIIEEHFK
jgi:hypothetical protein